MRKGIFSFPPACAAKRLRPEAMFALVNPKPQWQHTCVVKGDTEASDAFKTFAMAKAVCGAGMCAIHQTRSEAYLVITFRKGGREKSKIRKIKGDLFQLPGAGSAGGRTDGFRQPAHD